MAGILGGAKETPHPGWLGTLDASQTRTSSTRAHRRTTPRDATTPPVIVAIVTRILPLVAVSAILFSYVGIAALAAVTVLAVGVAVTAFALDGSTNRT